MICNTCDFFSGSNTGEGKCHVEPPKVKIMEAGTISQVIYRRPLVYGYDIACKEHSAYRRQKRMKNKNQEIAERIAEKIYENLCENELGFDDRDTDEEETIKEVFTNIIKHELRVYSNEKK